MSSNRFWNPISMVDFGLIQNPMTDSSRRFRFRSEFDQFLITVNQNQTFLIKIDHFWLKNKLKKNLPNVNYFQHFWSNSHHFWLNLNYFWYKLTFLIIFFLNYFWYKLTFLIIFLSGFHSSRRFQLNLAMISDRKSWL